MNSNGQKARLREVLLELLQLGPVGTWPGCDGMTVDDILDHLPQAVADGKVAEWQQLLARHPDIADELLNWLAEKDRWQFAYRWQR